MFFFRAKEAPNKTVLESGFDNVSFYYYKEKEAQVTVSWSEAPLKGLTLMLLSSFLETYWMLSGVQSFCLQ